MSIDQATTSSSGSAPACPALNVRQTFHLEEYKALRAEIVTETTRYNQMKFILIAALGASYSWIFTNLTGTEGGKLCLELQLTPLLLILSIPVFVVFMVSLEAFYQLFTLRHLESYLERIETYFDDDKTLGWHQLRRQYHHRLLVPIGPYYRIGLFWIILLLACTAVSFGFYRYAIYQEVTTCGAGNDQLDTASVNVSSRDTRQAPLGLGADTAMWRLWQQMLGSTIEHGP